MSQLTGPVGAGATDPYYTSNQYEKEQERFQAIEEGEQEKQKVQRGETGPSSVNPLAGIQQAIGGFDATEAITGAIDNTLGTNLQEGYIQRREAAKQTGPAAQAQRQINQQTGPLSETVRVAANVGVGAIESTLDTLDLTGDILKAGAMKLTGGKVKPTEDPFSDRYTAAAYSFGLQKPKTQIGQTAAKLANLVVITRQAAKALPKGLVNLGTKGQGLKGAIASGIVPGAVADFLLTSKEDGNFSKMVKDMLPQDSPIRDSFLLALASDDDDNIFTAKLKGTLEGSVFSAVADGFGFMLFGRKAAQAALKAGATKEEALQEGLKAVEQQAKQVDAAHAKAVEEEAARWGAAHQTELEELTGLQTRYGEQLDAMRAAGIDETDPRFVALNETLTTVNKNIEELDEAISRGYDPDDARELLPQEAAARVVEGDPTKAIAQQHVAANGTSSTTGLNQMDLGGAVSGSMRNQMWESYQKGSTRFAGVKDPALVAAQRAGISTNDRKAFDAFLDQYGKSTTTPKTTVSSVTQVQSFSPPGTVRGSTHMLTDAQFRISNITGDAEELIRNVSKRADLQAAAAEARTSVNAIVQSAADELQNFRAAIDGETSNEQLIDLMKQAELIDPENTTGKVLSKKGILVTKSLIRDTALQINEIATNAAALREAGELDGNSFDRVVDRLVTLLDLHKYTAQKTGSTLNIFKFNAETFDDAAEAANNELTRGQIREWALRVKQLQRSSDPKAQEEMDKLIQAMVLAGGDPSKTVRFGAVAVRQGIGALTQSMYQSMLSGPITHLRNVFGNSYSLLERPFSTYLRGALKNDKALRDSSVAGLHGMFNGFGDAWQTALTTLRTGDSVNFEQKFVVDDFETRAILEQMQLAARTDGEKVAAGFLYNTYRALNNPWLSWPSRALMASDDFFKSMSARYRMHSKAMYEAMAHSAEDADVDFLFNKYIEGFSKGIDPQTGRILDKDLLDYAERVTFQNDPGSFMNSIGNAVDQFPMGIGRLFIPFVRTPANLIGYGLEHMPIISRAMRQYSETYQAAIKSGDQLLMAEMEGREATGALLVGTMVMLGLSTDVTGNLPFDPAERNAWREEGRPPMSIRVGNKWVSYASFEPVNSMLSIVADAMRLVKVGGADAAGTVMRQLQYSIMASYTEKSFLAGISTLGEMLNPRALTDPSGMSFILNSANTILPYSGVRRAFANALDPYLKETRGELDRMLVAAAPGFGRDLATVTSPITGKQIRSTGGGIFNAVSPIRVYDVDTDPVVRKLTEIGYPTNQMLKRGHDNVELLPQHRERLAQILAKSGLRNALNETFNRPAWKQMAEAFKGRPITADMLVSGEDASTPPHIKQVNKLISSFKKAALRRLYEEDAEYRALVAKSRDTQIRALQGDFGPNPDLEELLEF